MKGWTDFGWFCIAFFLWLEINQSVKHIVVVFKNKAKPTVPLTWFYCKFIIRVHVWLDKSTARRHLKSPRSLSGRSLHFILVTKTSRSWPWMTPFCSMSTGPPIPETQLFQNWPWKSKVKVLAKAKPNGHIWGLEFNRYVCFSFRGNQTIFGWDIANFIFDQIQGQGQIS